MILPSEEAWLGHVRRSSPNHLNITRDGDGDGTGEATSLVRSDFCIDKWTTSSPWPSARAPTSWRWWWLPRLRSGSRSRQWCRCFDLNCRIPHLLIRWMSNRIRAKVDHPFPSYITDFCLPPYHHFNDTESSCLPVAILILLSLASSSRMGFSNAYLIPVRALNLLRSIFPPLLTSIQRIRSRGDCERLVISRLPPVQSFDSSLCDDITFAVYSRSKRFFLVT